MSTKKREKKQLLVKSWAQKYVMLKDLFIANAQRMGYKKTDTDLQRYLGIGDGKLRNWRDGQWPSAEDLEILHEKFGFSFSWLVTGEGDPFIETATSVAWEKETSLLREQIIELQKELLAAQKEIISMLKNETTPKERAAPGGNTVVPLSAENNDQKNRSNKTEISRK